MDAEGIDRKMSAAQHPNIPCRQESEIKWSKWNDIVKMTNVISATARLTVIRTLSLLMILLMILLMMNMMNKTSTA